MLQNISILVQLERKKFIRFAAFVLLALSLGLRSCQRSPSSRGSRLLLRSKMPAALSLLQCRRPTTASLLGILGPAGNDIVSSGDPIEDLDARTNFTTKYEEMHRFVTEPNGTVTLVVGAENWPLPIPLVNKNGAWYFDTQAGKDEILFRRIGKNELACDSSLQRSGGCPEAVLRQGPYGYAKEYAQKLVSDEGKHNGLYWEETGDQFDSPIDPLIAYARQNRPTDQVGDARSVQWLFFPDSHEPRTPCTGWRQELCRRRKDDCRIRLRRLSCGVPLLGRDDFHCQQIGNHL